MHLRRLGQIRLGPVNDLADQIVVVGLGYAEPADLAGADRQAVVVIDIADAVDLGRLGAGGRVDTPPSGQRAEQSGWTAGQADGERAG